MMEQAIITLKILLELYKVEKKNAATKEYNIYYAGAVDAISKAIKKLES